ncbi:MAG: hypothetical protein U0838_09855 [Chloroflexota bacterium]
MVEGSTARRVLAGLVVVVLLGACSGSTPTQEPSAAAASGSAGAASASAAPATPLPTLAPVPSYAFASPATVDGVADESELVPPDFETGDVPAPEAPAAAVKTTVKAGGATPLASQSLGPDGGTISVAKPGDALDGLTITVPAGTYASSVSFTVSEKPLDGTAIAAGYTAASAVVSIDNGGAVATGDPVLVRIPATLPDKAEVIGLYLHDDGSLDPLPVVAQDAKGATVAASHFSDLILALVDWSVIPRTVDSGFRPGRDDWQFTNYGSFVAPGGHCEGQSVTAIWYYDTQRLAGASGLSGLLDNNGADPKTPSLWLDDSDGYRFASAVQAAPIAVPRVYNAFQDLGRSWDTAAYQLFRAAIALTGHPQLLTMTDAQGGHGHAMIAYRVTPERIYVADPNYPGKLRTIKWDAEAGVLGPYYSGDNAGSIAAGGGVAYTRFSYVPARASAADSAVAAEWAKLEAGKAGDDVFPSLPLEYVSGVDELGDDVWSPLPATLTTDQAELRVRIVGTPAGSRLGGYAGAKRIQQTTGEVAVPLKDGANDVGLSEFGAKNGSWKYVDFVRVAVTREPIDINGTWLGTLTFDTITVDEATKQKAEDEGCDFAIVEALKDKALPTTLEIDVDKATGDGTGKLTIDARSVAPQSSEVSEPEPVELKITYKDGKVTFDLTEACGGSKSACTMTGLVSGGPTPEPADDIITGEVIVKGDGYSAHATFEVKREP